MLGDKTMKILIIGDIVGNSGVKKVKEVIPNYVNQNKIDFVIANGENSRWNGHNFKDI